jgi:phytoene dehydrogenase-like protein
MTDQYDVLIIGAGHNGLVCAAYLAKAGKKVLVLERADQTGGAAKTREIASGVKASACAHILHMLQPKIVKDLKLGSHGLDTSAKPLKTISLAKDGKHLTLDRRSVSGADISDADKSAYSKFMERMETHAGALSPQWLKAPPRLAGAGLANAAQLAKMGWDIRFGLGKEKMQDFVRIVGMNVHALLDEDLESEALKAALAFDAVLGTALEPRMATSVLTWIFRIAGGLGSEMTLPRGGMGNVTDALEKAARGFGAEIRTGVSVERILLDGGEAVGVVVEGGEEIRARKVVSNADPKTTFLKLVGARNLEAGFANRIGHVRSRGRAAKVNIVLNGLPTFVGLDESALQNRLVIAPSRRYMELAFNPAKYGELPDEPVMEITLPSLGDPSLAPAGKHVLSAVIQYVPYDVKGGWETQREALMERVLETLSGYSPDLKDKVQSTECLTPKDIEEEFGMTGGHWHHGELAIDQMFMMRPVHGTAQYATPIDGLYLCGAGAHPGGGVMGAAGHNAAKTIIGEVK